MGSRGGLLKEKLQAGETVIGPFVIVPSMTMIDTLGYSGMDFCIIDTEHGPISMETAADMVIAADGTDIAPIIRVGDNDERLILRALDIGSAGVQVPQINDPDDAKKLVNSAKYSPIGERGLSIFTRAGDYFKDGAPGHTDRQNDETVVIGHIEGKRGLDNLDEIMEVDGIDVYFLGPYDISQSLGIPGDVRNPIVEEALVEACGKAKAAGKSVGSYARDIDMGRWLLSNGVQYLAYNVDATVYMEACERIMGELRA